MPPNIDCDKVHLGACVVITHPRVFGLWLMIHRTGAHGFNRWSVPGGWVDKGETIEEAALRELTEELGSDIKISPPEIFAHTNDVPDLTKNHIWHSYTVWLKAVYLGGTPVNMEPEKADKIKWVSPGLLKEEEMFGPLQTLMKELQ